MTTDLAATRPRRQERTVPPTGRITPGRPATTRTGRWARWRDKTTLLAFALPGMAVLLAFHYVPLFGNVIAFKDYLPFLGVWESDWSGFDNFRVIFDGDPAFLNALKNTLIITGVQTLLVFPLPIVLALLLNSLISERWKRIVQSITYLPHFLSWVFIVALFQQFLGGAGFISTFIRQHGGEGLNIIGNADAFIALITSQVIWKDTGWATILFLAALSQIDTSLYEASAVDGASRWRQMWHVTLPGLTGVIILLFILRLGDALSVGFEQIILQQPAVGLRASEVLDTYVYNQGIIGGDWGVAAAVGLVRGLVGVILVFGANKIAHLFGQPGVYQR
ncbi:MULTISPECIES: ABC transporter permease [unclassified Plantibacter]|jgi:putative aldouronate transport system permease protein|uniref:ABC transporter permease n=1 Tax=unclassified Plantibacter TaxID=2624265 RepID=UPI003D32E678